MASLSGRGFPSWKENTADTHHVYNGPRLSGASDVGLHDLLRPAHEHLDDRELGFNYIAQFSTVDQSAA